MSLGGKLAMQLLPALTYEGTEIATGVRALILDSSGKALLATGTTKPADAGDLYAKGCVFIDTDVATGIKGSYVNTGTAASCVFTVQTATDAEVNAVCDGATVTATELNQLDASANIAKMTPGAAITASAEDYKVSTVRVGNIITTEIYIDLTGLESVATDLDVIGKSTPAAHIGQVTTAVNGLLFSAKVACVEVPATGLPDINICSATAGTYVLSQAMAGVGGYVLDFDSGGNLAIDGEEEFSTMPVANSYMYLISGAASGAGTYTAGKLVITLKGLVV